MGNALSNKFVLGALGQAKHAFDSTWSVLTSPHVGPSLRKRHFTKKELHERLICFGLAAGSCLSLLAFLGVLAIAKRKHGSLRRAYGVFFDSIAKWKSFANSSNQAYHRLEAEELLIDDKNDSWPASFVKEASAEDRAKDKAKLDAKLALLRQQNDGVLPEEYEHLVEEAAEDSEASKPGKTRAAGQASNLDDKITASAKADLFQIQKEWKQEHKTTNVGFVDWILWAKIPISIFLYLCYACTCVGIPLWAARSASCTQGFPWEVHAPFLCVFFIVKLWELFLFACDDSIPGQLGTRQFCIKFGSSFLGFMDGYSDAVSIVIAHACGSDLWYLMAFFYLFGVVFMQWFVMGILSLRLDSSGTCFYKMMHMDALSLCCRMDDKTDKHALLAWRLVNIFRTLLEDVPQCVLQLLFIHYVKQNYVMVISVVIGVCTSFLAVWAALQRAADAVGMNWERLQALSDMNKAIADNDMKAFADAAAKAEAEGYLEAEELDEQWVKAETAFDLPCSRPYVALPVANEAEEGQEEILARLERSAAGESRYSDGLRTISFAIEAASKREQFLRAAETLESAAFKRGVHHEGSHTKHEYDSRRRTVEFAVRAQEEREKRIQAMLVDAS